MFLQRWDAKVQTSALNACLCIQQFVLLLCKPAAPTHSHYSLLWGASNNYSSPPTIRVVGSIPTHCECTHYARRTSGSKVSTKQQKYSVGPTRRWPRQRLTGAEIHLITQISRVNNAGDLSSESKALNTPLDPTWPHGRDTANPLEKRVCVFYHINPVLVSVSVFLLNVTKLICVSENLKLY